MVRRLAGALVRVGRGWLSKEEFVRLLEGAAGSPDTRLSGLPLLTPAEHSQLVVEWNDTAALSEDACLHDLFEAQVQRTPAAVALVFEGEELRYDELGARADRLARHLRRLGVKPGVLVPAVVGFFSA